MGNPFGSATGKLQLQGAGKFPIRANHAVPAREDPGRDLGISRLDAQVANVAWLTVVDAVYRLPRMTGNTGRGLRGGSYAATKSPAATTITYRRAQFTDDVQISGGATVDSDNRLEATVTVNGPDGERAPTSSTRPYGTRPNPPPRSAANSVTTTSRSPLRRGEGRNLRRHIHTMSTEASSTGVASALACTNGNSTSASAMGEAPLCASNRGFTCVPS